MKVIIMLLIIFFFGCTPFNKNTKLNEKPAGFNPPINLKQYDQKGTEIPVFAPDVEGIASFTAMLPKYQLCTQTRLEIEKTQVVRPYTGNPTKFSEWTPICKDTITSCPVQLPSVSDEYNHRPSGRAYKWRARVRYKYWVSKFGNGGFKGCGSYISDNVSVWTPFNKNHMAFRYSEDWIDTATSIRDWSTIEGEDLPGNDADDMWLKDNHFFWIDSSTGGSPKVKWIGEILFENKQSVANGFLHFVSKSSNKCLQSIELFNTISNTWVLLDVREVDDVDTVVDGIPLKGDLRGYLSPFGGDGLEQGEMLIRVTCEGLSGNFRHGFGWCKINCVN